MARAADSIQQHAVGTEPLASGSPSTSEGSSETVFINPEFATQLKRKRGDEEGFLYDKRNKTYVELHEGIVMVGHAADGWRQTYAGESTPTGKKIEQIPGSTLWREIGSVSPISPVQSAPATQRSPAPSDSRTLIDNLVSRQTEALDLSAGPWRNWGRSTRPESGESIEIDGLHYPILAQNLGSDSGLVYLQHPGFTPHRFDAFESMLRDEPSRQPMWARKRAGHWQVLDGYPPFEMSPSQYVATAFRHLSQRYTAPGSNFADPDFLAGLGAVNKRHLDQYLSQVEVAHLVGGVQRLSADTQTLFIVREG